MPEEEIKDQQDETTIPDAAVSDEAVEEGSQEAGKVDDKGEQEPASTKPTEESEPEWWKNEAVFSPGLKSEEDALNTIKEQRAWTNKTQQENQKLKLKEEAFEKYLQGEIGEGEINKYVQEKEDAISKKRETEEAEEALLTERVNMAVEICKVRYPDIVTDDNLPLLDALAFASKGVTPLERVEDAVKAFKKIAEKAAKEQVVIKTKQEEMKEAGDLEGPAGRGKEEPVDAWSLSSEEFDKKAQGLVNG